MTSRHDVAVTTSRDTEDWDKTTAEAASDVYLDACQLQPFEEVKGRLIHVERCDGQAVVLLSTGTVSFPVGSTEADIAETELIGHEGDVVHLLRLDLPQRPIVVRVESGGDSAADDEDIAEALTDDVEGSEQ